MSKIYSVWKKRSTNVLPFVVNYEKFSKLRRKSISHCVKNWYSGQKSRKCAECRVSMLKVDNIKC